MNTRLFFVSEEAEQFLDTSLGFAADALGCDMAFDRFFFGGVDSKSGALRLLLVSPDFGVGRDGSFFKGTIGIFFVDLVVGFPSGSFCNSTA